MLDATQPAKRADAQQLFQTLWRHRVLIPLVVIVAAGAAAGLSASQHKRYSATSTLLFRDPAFDQKLFGGTIFQQATDPAREAATNVRLVSLDTVANSTAKALGHGLSGAAVRSEISVAAAGQSDLVNVTATDRDPQFAAQMANTFADEYIAFRRDADRSKIQTAQRLVGAQIARLKNIGSAGQRIKELETQDEALGVMASLQTGNAERVQSATPDTTPVSPRPVRTGILGGLVGLLLGVLIAVLIERIDKRFRTMEEIETATGLSLLAAVPSSSDLLREQQGSWATELPELEAFRGLRARLRYFNVDRDIKTLLITSPAPGDGKTTIAWNLAAANAVSGAQRVLLIECDLRRPTLATVLRLPPGAGLADVLAHNLHWSEAIHPVEFLPGRRGPSAAGSFDVLPAGIAPPNPAEMLESDAMAQLLDACRNVYDVVILDTPPIPVVSDAIPLISHVDGVILVTNLGRTRREATAAACRQLAQLKTPVLGVVVNAVKRRGGAEYGYYGYSSVRDAATTEQTPPDGARSRR